MVSVLGLAVVLVAACTDESLDTPTTPKAGAPAGTTAAATPKGTVKETGRDASTPAKGSGESALRDRRSTAWLFDTSSGQVIAIAEASRSPAWIEFLGFEADGAFSLIGDGVVRTFDADGRLGESTPISTREPPPERCRLENGRALVDGREYAVSGCGAISSSNVMVYVEGCSGSQSALRMLDLATGARTLLLEPAPLLCAQGDGVPWTYSWSPGGDFVLFRGTVEGPAFLADVHGGVRQVSPTSSEGWPAWRPQGDAYILPVTRNRARVEWVHERRTLELPVLLWDESGALAVGTGHGEMVSLYDPRSGMELGTWIGSLFHEPWGIGVGSRPRYGATSVRGGPAVALALPDGSMFVHHPLMTKDVVVPGASDARWSPDGRWVAYARTLPDRSVRVEAFEPATGRTLILTEDIQRAPVSGAVVERLFWSGDSRRLLIVVDGY